MYATAIEAFVSEYGLLGLFSRHFRQHPILPEGKFYVAPEAVIGSDGRLQRVDPATHLPVPNDIETRCWTS